MDQSAHSSPSEAAPAALPKGIRRRGKGFAIDVSVDGKRRTRTAPTLEDAILLRRQIKAEMLGEPVAFAPVAQKRAWTIKKAIDVTEKVAWKNSDWGAVALHHARKFAKFVGDDRPLDTIDLSTLDQWSIELEDEGISDSTINRYLASVSKVMSVAQERGGLATRPKVPRRKEHQGRIRYLSQDEETAVLGLLEKWEKLAERDLFILLIDTGLRLGEALRLEARDVDFKTGVLSVWRTKNELPRSVLMTERVRAVLERNVRLRPSGILMKASRHSFRQAWDRARGEMGLRRDKQFVPHALRHTCASRLVQRGVPLRVVQEWMGHKTVSVTMRYAHLSPTSLLEALEVLEPAAAPETKEE